MEITRTSMLSGSVNTREINITTEQLDRIKQGELIQRVCPDLSEDEREFLITGITANEWDQAFSEEADDWDTMGIDEELGLSLEDTF